MMAGDMSDFPPSLTFLTGLARIACECYAEDCKLCGRDIWTEEGELESILHAAGGH
jgi:hypothetical protein